MNTTTVLPNRKSSRPATGAPCDSSANDAALNLAGSIASLNVIRIGVKMLAPIVAAAGLVPRVTGGMVSAVVKPATNSARITWPTRSWSALIRSEYFVCSLSGASGVSVIALSPSVSDTVLATLPFGSDNVTFVMLTREGSIGSDITTRIEAFFGTPVDEAAGTTSDTTGAEASSVMSPRRLTPASVPSTLASPVPIGSCRASVNGPSGRVSNANVPSAVDSVKKCLPPTTTSAVTPTAAPPVLSSSTRPLRLPVGSSTTWTTFDSPGFRRSLTTPLVVNDGGAEAMIVNDLADTSGNEKRPSASAKPLRLSIGWPCSSTLAPAAGLPLNSTLPLIWLMPASTTRTLATSPSKSIDAIAEPDSPPVCGVATMSVRPSAWWSNANVPSAAAVTMSEPGSQVLTHALALAAGVPFAYDTTPSIRPNDGLVTVTTRGISTAWPAWVISPCAFP